MPASSFRTAFHGYEKESVNRFIEETDRAFAEAEEQLKKEIASLKKQFDELKKENDGLKKEVEEKRRLENIGEKLTETKAECDSLRAENEKLKSEYSDLAKQFQTMKDCKAQDSKDREKAEMYDKVSEQIGAMLVEANAAKESIIREAIEKAEKDAEDLSRTSAETLLKSMEIASSEIASELDSYLTDLNDMKVRLSDSVKSMRAAIDARRGDALVKIKNSGASLS